MLAVFYLVPRGGWPQWQVALAILFVGLLTLGAIKLALELKLPFVTVGWFWFLGMLVPVLGIVQVGIQAYADRYTYLPLIGCLIILVWGGAAIAVRARLQTSLVVLPAMLVIIALGLKTFSQIDYWKNTEALFTECAAVTEDNFVAHNNLAATLITAEKYEKAKEHCLEAIRIYPQFSLALQNLAVILTMQGDFPGAESYLKKAIALGPEAAFQYRKLADALNQQGKAKPAIEYYRAFLKLRPDDATACNNLAWLVATSADPASRSGTEAVGLAEHACALTEYKITIFVGTLAAAYAEAGRFEDAVATAQKAIQMAHAAGDKQIEQRNQQLLDLYRAGKPFHEG